MPKDMYVQLVDDYQLGGIEAIKPYLKRHPNSYLTKFFYIVDAAMPSWLRPRDRSSPAEELKQLQMLKRVYERAGMTRHLQKIEQEIKGLEARIRKNK